jgi:hypothetical protein
MSANQKRAKKGKRDDGLVTVAISGELDARVQEERSASAPSWGLLPKRQFVACLLLEALEARQKKGRTK